MIDFLGLAFREISQANTPTFIEQLFEQRQIAAKIFSFYLYKPPLATQASIQSTNQSINQPVNQSNIHSANQTTNQVTQLSTLKLSEAQSVAIQSISQSIDQTIEQSINLSTDESIDPAGSQMLIGGYDAALVPDGLTWHPLIDRSHMWLTEMTSISLNDDLMNFCGYKPIKQSTNKSTNQPTKQPSSDSSQLNRCVALIDTGTSFIGLPSDVYDEFIKKLIQKRPDCLMNPMSGSRLVQCAESRLDDLPVLTIGLNGLRSYDIHPADYMFDGHTVGIMPLHIQSTNQQPNQPVTRIVILGDTFLHAFYTIFDMDIKAIGIANNNHNQVINQSINTSTNQAPVRSTGFVLGLTALVAITAGSLLVR